MSRTGVEDKQPWKTLPPAIREMVQTALGSPVVRANRVWGGYSPTPTFRLQCADGSRAFFKGTNQTVTEFARGALALEEHIYRHLGPIIREWAPEFYASFNHADWHVVLLEDLGPKSVPPWTATKTRAVTRAIAAFHKSTVGIAHLLWVPLFTRILQVASWSRTADQTGGLRGISALAGEDAESAYAWLQDASPLLDRLIKQSANLSGAYALLHCDLRSDNLRFNQGGLRLFDWPAIMVGPPAWDIVPFAQSVTVEGGVLPDQIVTWYQEEFQLPEETLDSAIAWYIAFFGERACQPEISGLPRLRVFQRQQLGVMLAWAARRFSMAEPVWARNLLTS